MDELDEIRKKKLAALQHQQEQAQQQEQQSQEQIQQLEMLVKRALTKEALERYGNVKAAFPEKAMQLMMVLAQGLQTGQVKQIDDNTLKEILKKLTPKKQDIKIKRV